MKGKFIELVRDYDIEFIRNVSISDYLDRADVAIILSCNERSNRSLWEVGYMLENIFLQLRSLKISYASKIFGKNEMKQIAKAGISEAVAAVLF